MNEQERQARSALWVLFGINTMNFFDRQIIAAVGEPIRHEWMLSDTALGWLATAFTLFYAMVGVPIGRISDRWQRSRILSVGVTVWSIFTAASGLAWNYWSLFAVRLGVGVGEASCAPAGNSLIGDLFPAGKRARAISIFMLGLPVGIFFSNLLGGLIAKAYGWRAAFYLASIPGLILALLALKIKEPRRGGAETYQVSELRSQGSPYWRVLSIPTMWWIILSGALHNFNAYAVNVFLPAFLGRYHGMDVRQANTIAAFVLGAVGVVGLLAGGWAADRISKSRRNGRLMLASGSLLLSTPLVYLALERPKGDLVTYMLLMGIGWMLIFVYYVTVYSAIQDVVEPGLRATAMALYFFAMYVLGGSFGTSIVGMLSDHYARLAMATAGLDPAAATVIPEQFKAAGLHSAFYAVPLVSLVLAGVLWMASRTVAADMERLQRRMQDSSEKDAAPLAAELAAVKES
ncbi:MAG TPA: MFS transporter [Blastocatellia bacterium]|nr:MFS transporter [Blastocatellia bacterium]